MPHRLQVSPLAAVLLAGAVAVVVFLPTLQCGFVYDDFHFYAENPGLTRLSVLWRAFTDGSVQSADSIDAGIWRPVRTLSFAVDRALFGDSVVGPHLTNVIVHGIATALLARLLLLWRMAPIGALVGALVYALHPVQVECVGWISSRGDLLAIALVFAALQLDLAGRGRWAVVAGCAALLAKEQAVVWPAFVVLSGLLAGRTWRPAARAAVPAVVATVVFVVVRQLVLPEPFQEGGLGLAIGAREVALMLGHQAWFTLLPVGAAFDWQLPPSSGSVVVVLAGLLVVAGLVGRPTRLAAAWFLVALVPTLFVQLVVPLNILVADRFLLFALPALALLAARAMRPDTKGVVPAAVVTLCLVILTSTGVPAWRSNGALWHSVVQRHPEHWRANAHLGADALAARDAPLATEFLERAARAAPRDGQTRYRLGLAYELGLASTKANTREWIEALGRVQREYVAAAAYLGDARAGAREDLPLAVLAAAHFNAVVEEGGIGYIEALVAGPVPEVDPSRRRAWADRIEALARQVDRAGAEELARRVRDWGRQP